MGGDTESEDARANLKDVLVFETSRNNAALDLLS